MRHVSCSECGKMVQANKTDLVEYKRVCHQCKKDAKNRRIGHEKQLSQR